MVTQQTIPTATLRQLRQADWDRLWLKGLVWARYEARRYYGLARMEREIVQTAIEKTFSGERTWKPDICDLPHHLRMTIRSLYNSEVKKLGTRRAYARMERAGSGDANAMARAQERLDDLRDLLRKLKANDPDLAEFFLKASQLLLDGCDTEGEVASMMGLSPSQFSKRKARISEVIATAGRDNESDAEVLK